MFCRRCGLPVRFCREHQRRSIPCSKAPCAPLALRHPQRVLVEEAPWLVRHQGSQGHSPPRAASRSAARRYSSVHSDPRRKSTTLEARTALPQQPHQQHQQQGMVQPCGPQGQGPQRHPQHPLPLRDGFGCPAASMLVQVQVASWQAPQRAANNARPCARGVATTRLRPARLMDSVCGQRTVQAGGAGASQRQPRLGHT